MLTTHAAPARITASRRASASLGIEVSPREEDHSERSIDQVQQLRRPASECESGQTHQALDRGQTGHHEVARAEPAGDLSVSKVSVGAPDRKHESEREKCAGTDTVEKYKYLHQPVGEVLTCSRK